MIIYIGADHRGFQLKEILKKQLSESGYEFVDVGNDHYDENDDYPDFAASVGQAINQDPLNRRGILVCGSGAGVDIVANKFKSVRSVLAINSDQALASRNDDDTNVLSLAADFLTEDEAKKILATWLQAPFSSNENHQRRLEKIKQTEVR